MEQYFPRAHVGKKRRQTRSRSNEPAEHDTSKPDAADLQSVRYAEINRPVQDNEVDSVKAAAKAAGLHRFIEPAEYAGFHT